MNIDDIINNPEPIDSRNEKGIARSDTFIVRDSSDLPEFYNAGQRDAITRTIDWAYDLEDYNRFVIKGPAGTGKTTIMKEIIKRLPFRTGICITAPTHKACRVASKSANLNAKTIHKICGFRPNFNLDTFDPVNVQFDPLGKPSIENEKCLIVDEGSMLVAKFVIFIENLCKLHKVKLIIIGDPYQLPPVNERSSTAFDVPDDHCVELTEVVRQGDDNPVSDILVMLRDSIKRKNYNYLTYMLKHPKKFVNGKGYWLMNDINEFTATVNRAFLQPDIEKDVDWVKYLAYTNDNILDWNKHIRDCIFPGHDEAPVISDDLITSYSTVVDEFMDAKITNSEDYIIQRMTRYENKWAIKGFLLQLVEVATGKVTPNLFVVDHTDFNSFARFKSIAIQKMNYAEGATYGSERSKRWKDFFEFKNENLIMVDITKDTGYKEKKIINKDLDYGYGVTIHKSQGSTYTHVFVNLTDIIYRGKNVPSSDVELVNRLFYVGASRTKYCLFIYYK